MLISQLHYQHKLRKIGYKEILNDNKEMNKNLEELSEND